MILPTGHTPLGMYEALRADSADGSLPAEEATLFQLDEYAGLGPEDERSYRAYLRRELAGVRFRAICGLDGSAADPEGECARHQALLDEAPIDLVVLGIGRDGHVAFDEPGAPVEAGARLVRLHAATREDAAADFGGLAEVPGEALTVGLRTLLLARELLLLVSGEAKARALKAMLRAIRRPTVPRRSYATIRAEIVADLAAASLLRPQRSWSSKRAVVVPGHREPGVSAEHRISDESPARIDRAIDVCRADPPRAVILTGYTRTSERAVRGRADDGRVGRSPTCRRGSRMPDATLLRTWRAPCQSSERSGTCSGWSWLLPLGISVRPTFSGHTARLPSGFRFASR